MEITETGGIDGGNTGYMRHGNSLKGAAERKFAQVNWHHR